MPHRKGGAPPASAFISMSNDATIRALQNNLDNIDRDLKENERTEKALIQAFGTDLQRDAIKNTGTPPVTPTSNITTGGGGGSYGGGGGSNPSNTPSPDDTTKKMKEEIEKLTADKNDALTKLNEQYRKGELKGYDDYVDQQYNRTKQYYDDVLAVYQKYGQEQSKEAADVRTKQADDEAKHDTEMVERKSGLSNNNAMPTKWRLRCAIMSLILKSSIISRLWTMNSQRLTSSILRKYVT